MRRMQWTFGGREWKGRSGMVPVRTCSALRKPAACLPILWICPAAFDAGIGGGSVQLRGQFSGLPGMQGWLAGRAQRLLWAIYGLRSLPGVHRKVAVTIYQAELKEFI